MVYLMSPRSRSFMVLCGMLIHSAMVARGSLVPLFANQIGNLRVPAEEDSDVSDSSLTGWRRLRVGPLPSLTDMIEPNRRRRAEPVSDGVDPLQAAPKSVVFTYDFPGNPTGSGNVADQSSTPPAFTTFGNWTRVDLMAGTTPNVWDNDFWNTTSNINRSQYTSFTITADAGWHLDLQSLTFSERATAGGPTKGEVQMFTNGSLYFTFDYNPDSQFTTRNLGFTPTTDANNVTSVEFRFYGWNGGTPGASLLLDNVAITLTVTPEVDAGRASAVFAALIAAQSLVRQRGKRQA